MSKVKVGDKIKIVCLDERSQECFPSYAGTTQLVIAVDDDGDPRFAADTSSGGLWVEAEYGGVFEIVE